MTLKNSNRGGIIAKILAKLKLKQKKIKLQKI
jgi:hypothetical protein